MIGTIVSMHTSLLTIGDLQINFTTQQRSVRAMIRKQVLVVKNPANSLTLPSSACTILINTKRTPANNSTAKRKLARRESYAPSFIMKSSRE